MDVGGHLIIVNPSLGWAWRFDARGEPVDIILSAAGTSVTNVAFGGAERRTTYFTESVSGSILRAELPESGCAVHRSPKH